MKSQPHQFTRAMVTLALFSAAVSPGYADPFVLEAKKIELTRQPASVLLVPFVKEGPQLDGKLTEPMWKEAAVVKRWINHSTALETPLEAELRMASDQTNLFVAFNVKVADMSQVKFKQPKGGDEADDRNSIELFFDPSAKGKHKYQLIANPVGLRYDAYNGATSWQGKWTSKGDVRSDGWSIEFVVPVSDLGREPLSRGNRYQGNFGYNAPTAENFSWTGKWGTPGKDYGDLFFGTQEEYARIPNRTISLWLDREAYDLRDVTAVGLIRLDAANQPNSGVTTRLRLLQSDKEIFSSEINPDLGPDVDLTLDMKSLPAGAYQAVAELVRDGKAIATATKEFRKEKRKLIATGSKEGRIPIRTWPEPDAKGVRWPINTGVPFAQDALWSADNVRLLGPNRKEVPIQTEVRSTWNRNGSVHWLGVDFVPTLSADQQEYTLEYGPKVQRAASKSPLRCDETPEAITVVTGPLKFSVNRKQFRLLDSAILDVNGDGKFDSGEQVIKPSDAAGLFLVDHEGKRYEAAFDRDAKVVVEEKGPVRVTIRAEGWYAKKGTDGKRVSVELPTDKLCKFTVRLSAYAGEPTLRMAVSSVVTYDTTKVRLRDLGLAFAPAAAQNVTVPTDDKQSVSWDAARLKASPHLLQHRWDKSVDDQSKEYSRAQGHLRVEGPKADMVVAVRNFWKLFPKEIEWREGALNLHIWPAHGRDTFPLEQQLQWPNIYKLWYAHQGRELDFVFPASYYKTIDDKWQPDQKVFSPYYQDAPKANAQGVCIHNELTINFRKHADPTAPDGRTLSYLTDANPHAAADPAYVCGTGVFGPLLHVTEEFAEVEKATRRGFESLASRSLANDEYGMFIHGGEHTYWDYLGKPPHALVHRVWINGHYSIATFPFIEYARSGNPIYLQWGRKFGENLRDIGVVHYVSTERQIQYHQLGAMYHCKGFLPWGGDSGLALHMAIYDFLIYDYYLTGNRRSLDVVHEWVQGLKAMSPGGWGTREGMEPMAQMVEAYRLTWDAGLVELLDRFEKPVFKPDSMEPYGFWDWQPKLLERYWLLTGSERALAAYRPFSGQAQALGLDAFLSMLDGKPDAIKKWQPFMYADSISYIDNPGVYGDGLTTHSWTEYIFPARKVPYALKAMKEFGLRPERPKVTTPKALPVRVQEKDSLVAVHENSDAAIPVKVEFRLPPSGKFGVTAYRADKTEVARQEWIPTNQQTKFEFTIPADGRADDYLLSFSFSSEDDGPNWPLTSLKKEVAIINGPARIGGGGEGQRAYFMPDAAAPSALELSTRSKRTAAFECLDDHQTVLGRGADSRYVRHPITLQVPTNAVPPLSLYLTDEIDIKFEAGKRLILAPSPDALFTPTLTEKPQGK